MRTGDLGWQQLTWHQVVIGGWQLHLVGSRRTLRRRRSLGLGRALDRRWPTHRSGRGLAAAAKARAQTGRARRGGRGDAAGHRQELGTGEPAGAGVIVGAEGDVVATRVVVVAIETWRERAKRVVQLAAACGVRRLWRRWG